MKKTVIAFFCLLGSAPLVVAEAGPAQTAILEKYATEAKAADPSFSGFSGECVSAWNKDPVSGVIGVQTRPH